MQQDADKDDRDNQDSTTNKSPTQTDNLNQVVIEPPPYTQYVQESLSDIRCMSVDNQNHDQTPSYKPEDALILPARNFPPHIDGMIVVTVKFRVLFIVSGIIFLILGAGALGIEVAIMMYSFSTYYRGVWAGNMLLATAISMLVVAGRTSHSIRYTKNLLACTLVAVALGFVFSAIELSTVQPCVDGELYTMCDSTTGKILKVTMVALLNFSLLFTLVILTCAQRIKS